MEAADRSPSSGRLAGSVLGIAFAVAAAVAITVILLDGRKIIVVAVAGLLLAPCLAMLSGNPRLMAIWGLVFCVPIEFSKVFTMLPHMGGEYAYRIDLTDIFLVVLVAMWIRDLVRSGNFVIRVPRPVRWLLLLVGLAVLSALTGHWREPAGMEVVRMLKVSLLFVWAANQLVSRGLVLHLVLALAAGSLLQSVIGLGQYFFDISLGLQQLGEADVLSEAVGGRTLSRVGALLGHPNILSGYLALVLPVPLALLFSRVSLRAKLFCALAVGVGEVALILTLSRSGWVAFGVALLVVLFLTGLHRGILRRAGTFRAVVIVLTGVLLLVSSKTLVDRFLKSAASNMETRWILTRNALRLLQMKPVLGYGKNSYAFEMAYRPASRPGRPSEYREDQYREPANVPPIHNIYIQQWFEQGTVGLIIFIVMIGSIIRIGLRNLRLRDDLLYAVNVGALAGVIAIFIHGLADWVYWHGAIMRVTWLLAGVIAALDGHRHREATTDLDPNRVDAPALSPPR